MLCLTGLRAVPAVRFGHAGQIDSGLSGRLLPAPLNSHN